MAQNNELTAISAQHNIHIQRLAAQLGNQAVPFIDNVQSLVAARLEREVGKNLTDLRRKKLLADIETIVGEQFSAYTKEVRKGNAELGQYEIGFQSKTIESLADDIETAITTKAAIVTKANNTLIKLGEGSYTTYNKMLSNFVDVNAEQITNIIANGFVSGQTTRAIASAVMGELDNKLAGVRKQAMTVAITGTNHYANQARMQYIEDNSDILKGFRLIATLDSRTSQKCRGLDQTVHKANESRFVPPLHPRCRTSAVPELDSRFKFDDEGGKRASNFRKADGLLDPKPVSSEQTYYDALADLSVDDQDLVLGKRLGAAFRKMSPGDFAKQTIDSLGNPLTLTEMARKDNELGRLLKKA